MCDPKKLSIEELCAKLRKLELFILEDQKSLLQEAIDRLEFIGHRLKASFGLEHSKYLDWLQEQDRITKQKQKEKEERDREAVRAGGLPEETIS